jgi:hypothetical protein
MSILWCVDVRYWPKAAGNFGVYLEYRTTAFGTSGLFNSN